MVTSDVFWRLEVPCSIIRYGPGKVCTPPAAAQGSAHVRQLSSSALPPCVLDKLELVFYNRSNSVTECLHMRTDVFHAIADPNRRAIIGLLARQPLTIGTVARNFTISRPAVSRHIKILAEAGLVTLHSRGRERYCEARLERLQEVSGWVEQSRRLWEARLDRLDEYLKDLQAN